MLYYKGTKRQIVVSSLGLSSEAEAMHIRPNKLNTVVLLFLTFFLATLALTFIFLKIVRALEDRKAARGMGRRKEDQMVSDEMRWQEGRLVTERKIVDRKSVV